MAPYIKEIPNKEFEEKVSLLTNELLKKLSGLTNTTSIKVLGSVPRRTYLKSNNLDIDIFVYYLKFDYDKFIEELSNIFPLEKIVPKNRGFPYATVHLNVNRFKLDVVPCLLNSENATDRTEKHHAYLSSLLTDVLREEIRKSKKIIKRIGLYNADSSVKGFSGYTIECLIVKYGSLSNIPDDIDYFIDPVDPSRNLFASVSPENLQRFHVLKNNRFRSIRRKKIEEIYFIPNAPLSWHYTLKNHPNVTACVYVSGVIYLQLKDHFIVANRHIPYSNSYWTESQNQFVYYSTTNGLKKIPPTVLIKKYGAIKTTNPTHLRIFNYFR